MALASGKEIINYDELAGKVNLAELLYYYFGITKIPCLINSPLRPDNHPSFKIYSPDGIKVYYKDFSTMEQGGVVKLLSKIWGLSYEETMRKIHTDLPKIPSGGTIAKPAKSNISVRATIDDCYKMEVRVRQWKEHDLNYWKEYGISLEWLKKAEVYPISHKVITSEEGQKVIRAEKYAYVYVERKDKKVSLKVYQPFSLKYKWTNKHDGSVISLWTKVPETGKAICICSSMKDALCLWANYGIPSIALQGEGYGISNSARKSLKERYENIFILFDNDSAGIKDGIKLSKSTGFTNLQLPMFMWGKDVSDYYKGLEDKSEFNKTMDELFLPHLQQQTNS